ncbi:mitochondrial biogenesis AIM24-domain-containing protein [Neohortaea acidophila]|uniref:Altered inheritance of mitochondria protein 24, mitochondrial n=1 Tax=Neohortaea acidophila TaxID=245834 RepID=A0A6A6Q413_9PEZI|nr:mitochondrial biogenesis AIM24-domain-containing protein [Neohortaea acidophila]KAF2487022.1 mitochondrial biogenesis AIM24-domain-containing protein [Neohortaea acidophila]
MRHRALDSVCASCRHCSQSRTALRFPTRRFIHISATPSATEPQQHLDTREAGPGSNSTPDARFEVLGTPFSLLSASISASQNLYTRKGTLVGFNGKAENAVSTLSLLEPFRRILFGIPFVYQRVSSTTPYTALISTKSAITSLVVVHLDGRLDWMVAQRNALLAWTGHTLQLSPRVNRKLSLAHWGSTSVSGRGLLALSGKGLIHQITLKTGDEYVIHPSNIIAYSVMQHAPQPYRFKASSMRFQIPNPLSWLPDTRFWRTMRETAVWRFFRDASFTIRTWARRTIWGDRLFLHFHGPATILVQSRGSSLRDVLTTRDVNELADTPAGVAPKAIALQSAAEAGTSTQAPGSQARPATLSFASVGREGTVKFDEAKQ